MIDKNNDYISMTGPVYGGDKHFSIIGCDENCRNRYNTGVA
jgi:hypothetical protein